MKVKYKDVGRDNRCWETNLPEGLAGDGLTEYIWNDVRTNGGLTSIGIDIILKRDDNGMIFVGGFRKVGTFKIIRN